MQRFNISGGQLGQSRILMTDPSDVNRLIAGEGTGIISFPFRSALSTPVEMV